MHRKIGQALKLNKSFVAAPATGPCQLDIRGSGFGMHNWQLAIYVANRPPVDDYATQQRLQPLAPGELSHIVGHCSNHWRKLFNVYAKFLFSLNWHARHHVPCASWQQLRDQYLLQGHGTEALLFSRPNFSEPAKVHIIAGKTYARHLDLPFSLHWLDTYFAVNKEFNTIVCPYLDYRQLSDARIGMLVKLTQSYLPVS